MMNHAVNIAEGGCVAGPASSGPLEDSFAFHTYQGRS
jgi:hypothetical protein